MKNILVTGGAGFIGNHLCKKLLDEGNYVVCVDNFCSSKPKVVDKLCENSNYEFVELDVASSEFCVFLSDFGNIDEIYHLACPASPKYYQRDPMGTIKTCVNGTINVLDYARKGCVKVLFTSTSEIYGDPLVHPQTEEYRGNVNTLGPRACYDEGKRLAETIMMEYLRLYGVDVKIVRIFNTYGPGMDVDDGRVLTNFVIQALKGDPLSVYGDGSQTRSFCYIDDMVRGLMLMMESKEHGPINLGNQYEITIDYLADLVIMLSRSTSGIKNYFLPTDDPIRRQPDITKAMEKLQWKPEICLEDGLKNMIEEFKRYL